MLQERNIIRKDAIIIGSGQAGNPLSEKLARTGWGVLMVEKSEERLGGTCINTGCTPTKTLIASAEQINAVEKSEEDGILTGRFEVDFSKIHMHMNTIVESFRSSIAKKIGNISNLELVFGKASFLDKHTISVVRHDQTEVLYSAPYIFINAGARPSIPKIDGLKDIRWYDSTSILKLEIVPPQLIIIGGSYIGVEMGQMFRRLGSEVAILERSEQILPPEDSDTSASLKELLEKEGIKIYLNASVKKVGKQSDKINVMLKDAEGDKTLTGTHVLLATGRTPNTDELNLDAAGIEVDKKGFILVDGQLKTSVEGVYALGDIKGGPQFTHIAYNDYVIVSKNILEKQNLSIEGRLVPYCVFTNPQLGRIGLTEKQARAEGLDFEVYKLEGKYITRGIETGKAQGLWKAIVEKKSKKILGAAILCTEGGEIASVVQMAMRGGISANELSVAIFSHPTYSESLNVLFQKPS